MKIVGDSLTDLHVPLLHWVPLPKRKLSFNGRKLVRKVSKSYKISVAPLQCWPYQRVSKGFFKTSSRTRMPILWVLKGRDMWSLIEYLYQCLVWWSRLQPFIWWLREPAQVGQSIEWSGQFKWSQTRILKSKPIWQ